MTIVANELRTKGVKAIKEILESAEEVFISVRGKKEYVVLKSEDYEKLKSYELDIAYLEAMHDIEAGDYKEQSAQEHLQSLKDALQNS
ncbi:MAG: prevent-host-death protein [Campylobacteraceae bacterium 4484_4]|nr:MAG: prevent-host-death protein [Campylobacteraceae bacterium 4484_4]